MARAKFHAAFSQKLAVNTGRHDLRNARDVSVAADVCLCSFNRRALSAREGAYFCEGGKWFPLVPWVSGPFNCSKTTAVHGRSGRSSTFFASGRRQLFGARPILMSVTRMTSSAGRIRRSSLHGGLAGASEAARKAIVPACVLVVFIGQSLNAPNTSRSANECPRRCQSGRWPKCSIRPSLVYLDQGPWRAIMTCLI